MPYESKKNTNTNTNANNKVNVANTSLPSPKERERRSREESTSKALGTAAKGAATALGGPVGSKVADAASKTKAGQELINKGGEVLNKMPGVGKAAKKLDDNGSLDKADKLVSLAALGKNKPNKNINPQGENTNSGGGNNESSLPSSASNNEENNNSNNNTPKIAGLPPFTKNDYSKDSLEKQEQEKENSKKDPTKIAGKVVISIGLKVLIILAPIIMLVVIIMGAIGSVIGGIVDFGDALGSMIASGGETGDVEYSAPSEEAEEFYERINDVKLSYQANGKNVDPLKIAAVYKILSSGSSNITYEDMTQERIEEIADCMFMGNTYSEETFRDNLLNYLIPKYLPNTTDSEREQMVDDVFDYIDRYYSFIGKETSTSCANIGSCIYDIDGFYIPGSGNVSKKMNVSNLMVRLMECGGQYGNGNDNKAIDQPMVPFEDYIMGVAYAEVGTSYPDEAIKAQMVVARSYALARPTAMSNANGKKLAQENGQWVLQIASCVSDQVFCNVDEGCSYMGGGDGQGGIVRSGIIGGAQRTNPPLAANDRLRSLAAEVQGEVIVNNQGYIIGTGFLSTEQKEFKRLAESGLNYKQIIMQVYNSGSRNYGATDLDKANCNNGDATCSGSSSTGPFSSWKQYSGPWTSIQLGNSSETIQSAGCLATSVAMLIAKSGVQTNISDFNPGTFVEYLNSHSGFSGANFVWGSVSSVAPSFSYQGKIDTSGLKKKEKMNKLKGLLESGYYVVAEVKGSTGQHWVAIDGISDGKILMMDPGSESTDMWGQYNWKNTSQYAYFSVN